MHHIYKDYYPGNIVVPVLKDVNLNVEGASTWLSWDLPVPENPH